MVNLYAPLLFNAAAVWQSLTNIPVSLLGLLLQYIDLNGKYFHRRQLYATFRRHTTNCKGIEINTLPGKAFTGVCPISHMLVSGKPIVHGQMRLSLRDLRTLLQVESYSKPLSPIPNKLNVYLSMNFFFSMTTSVIRLTFERSSSSDVQIVF